MRNMLTPRRHAMSHASLKGHWRPNRWRTPDVPALLIFSLAMTLLAGCGSGSATRQAGGVPGTAQNCDNPGAVERCYAYGYWTMDTGTFQSTITTVALHCDPGGCNSVGGFIDDEIWLADLQSAGSPYWVEVGYGTWITGTSTEVHYFWADDRPDQNAPYIAHMLPAASTNGGAVQYTIEQQSSITTMWTCPSGSTADPGFYITISGNGVQYDHYTRTDMFSSCNKMAPHQEDAGLEFYGMSGSISAPIAHFSSFSLSGPQAFSQSPAQATQYTSPEAIDTQCGC